VTLPQLGRHVIPPYREINSFLGTQWTKNSQLTSLGSLHTCDIVGASSPLQNFEMSPLEHHAHQWLITLLWYYWPCVYRKFLKGSIEVIGWCFCGQCQFVEKIEKGKHHTGFDCELECWIETMMQELDILRNGTVTAAVLNSNVMNPICM